MRLHVARGDRLSAAELHALLRLRAEVFVVEQACPYLDIDGLDLLPGTTHLWLAPPADPLLPACALRILAPAPPAAEAWRIGRVVTRPRERRRGLAASLVRDAIPRAGRPLRIGAQARLEAWYAGLGFTRDGDDYDEDGMAHVPMRFAGE